MNGGKWLVNQVFSMFQIFHGNQTLDEVMSRLLSAQETFTSQLATEVREEEQREARDAVKREQDLAYEMSLQVGVVQCKTFGG